MRFLYLPSREKGDMAPLREVRKGDVFRICPPPDSYGTLLPFIEVYEAIEDYDKKLARLPIRQQGTESGGYAIPLYHPLRMM